MHIRCPHCAHAIEVIGNIEHEIECRSCNSRFRITGDETLAAPESSGKMVAHFMIRGVLGTGAFGTVYRAYDTRLDREVALKIPRHENVLKELEVQFIREAQAAAQIKHPNIVAVHEIGRENNKLYIVSDLIEGITLGEWMGTGDHDEKSIARILIPILNALETAHESHIVHRDLKPSNILVDHSGKPHVSDFGLAKRQAPEEVTITHDGRVLGTPAYMPPEQARGEGYTATPASDVYSMGVILYEMLTGERPFKSTNSRVLLYQVMTAEPKPPRTLDPKASKDLQTICMKAMEKEPEKRYASAAEMAADLQNFVECKPIKARPISSLERARRWAMRNPTLASASAVIALLCAFSASLLLRGPDLIPNGTTMHRVLVETDPPDAELAVVRLNDSDRTWKADDIIFSTSATPCELELTPGDYLVVARVGERFHEVYRHVPKDPESTPIGKEPHNFWSVGPKENGGRLVWPRFALFSDAEVTAEMVHVPKGKFEFGKAGICGIPNGTHTVDGFYMDSSEVTVAAWEKSSVNTPAVATRDPGMEVQPTDSARGMKWDHAVMYAESVGKRLPAELEFEFVRTNRGQTVFPWGDDPKVIRDWSLARPAEFDVNEMGIRGLYSSVAEWTNTDFLCFFDGPANEQFLATFGNKRTYVGGDASVASGKPSPSSWCEATSIRFAEPTLISKTGVGLRCVRSERPRLLDVTRKAVRDARNHKKSANM